MKQLNYFDLCILETLLACQVKFGKNYSYPSQDTILSLLQSHHGVIRSRRWLNYRLRYLEDQGFIKRVRRIKRNRYGLLCFRSTLYWLKKTAWALFLKSANLYERAKLKVKRWWEQKKPAPVSQPEPADEQFTLEQRRANLARLRALLESS